MSRDVEKQTSSIDDVAGEKDDDNQWRDGQAAAVNRRVGGKVQVLRCKRDWMAAACKEKLGKRGGRRRVYSRFNMKRAHVVVDR